MKKHKIIVLSLLLLFVLLLSTGCIRRPFAKPIIVPIGPNETAIKLPLLGDNITNQEQFKSIDYLESNKVAGKQVTLQQEWVKTGRPYLGIFDTRGYWKPAEKIIIIKRNPVSLEWTGKTDTGTSSKNQALEGEDINSITFYANYYINAMIEEKDASTYLYYQGTDPNKAKKTREGWTYVEYAMDLERVLNNDAYRNFSKNFVAKTSTMQLAEIQSSKAQITDFVNTEGARFLEQRGITIMDAGWTGAILYDDPNIQKAINAEFIAEKEKAAQEVVNAKELAIAQNKVAIAEQEKLAAQKKMEAWDIIKAQRLLDIQENTVELYKEKWDGKLPTFMMGSGTNDMIMQLPSIEEINK